MNGIVRRREPADEAIVRAIEELDFTQMALSFWRHEELIVMQQLVPEPIVRAIRDEVAAAEALVVRQSVPGYKRSGSTSHFRLRDISPTAIALYRSDALRELLSALADQPLVLSPDDDPHACALYWYARAGWSSRCSTSPPRTSADGVARSRASRTRGPTSASRRSGLPGAGSRADEKRPSRPGRREGRDCAALTDRDQNPVHGDARKEGGDCAPPYRFEFGEYLSICSGDRNPPNCLDKLNPSRGFRRILRERGGLGQA